jgi:hypothetical protein
MIYVQLGSLVRYEASAGYVSSRGPVWGDSMRRLVTLSVVFSFFSCSLVPIWLRRLRTVPSHRGRAVSPSSRRGAPDPAGRWRCRAGGGTRPWPAARGVEGGRGEGVPRGGRQARVASEHQGAAAGRPGPRHVHPARGFGIGRARPCLLERQPLGGAGGGQIGGIRTAPARAAPARRKSGRQGELPVGVLQLDAGGLGHLGLLEPVPE